MGQQQRVEILKALYRGAEILILDEPTAVLTPQEAKELFAILESLRQQGKSIIFISHKLNEVLEVADRISVLRRGKLVETIPREGATEEGLARSMVGREVLLRVDKTPSQPGRRAPGSQGPLGARRPRPRGGPRGLLRRSTPARSSASPASTATARASSSTRSPVCGGSPAARSRSEVTTSRMRPRATRSTPGLGHIPEDRHRRGLILDFNLAENLVLHDYGKEPFSRLGWMNPRRWLRWARGLLQEFDVRGGGPTTRSGSLSGGNQQKVVIAREVSRDPSVLIAAQPTRGLDVGAIEFVHRRLVEQRDAGKAVLLVSLELEEILSLSDRILVLYEGKIVAEFPPDVTEEEVGIAMLGAGQRERAA